MLSLAFLLPVFLTAANQNPAPRSAVTPVQAVRGASAGGALDPRTPPPPDWQDVESTLGGRLFSFGDPFLAVSPTRTQGIFHLTFNGTGTGWQESFLLGIPAAPLSPAPLLVLFHGFGISEWDCFRNTGLMKRAMERGWYVVAPRGAHDMNFGVVYAQQNVEFVLDWVLATLDINRSRIYGVGFSMGGGNVTGYAARHLDPLHACFAAVVDHTGAVSISHVYYNSTPDGMAILEHPLMFGGSPAAEPFGYQRSSTIDLAFPQGPVDPLTDQARNLTHLPVQLWWADQDPLAYLVTQSVSMFDWLVSLGSAPQRFVVPSTEHEWRTLDEHQVLDFLEAQTLDFPDQGTHRLLADRDARYMHFTVQQDAGGAFTPFRWNYDRSQNRIVIDQTLNLKRLTVHTAAIGLDPTIELRVIPGTQDGSLEQIALDGYLQAPTEVRRNGQSSVNWSYDPQSNVVTLYESAASTYPQWLIVP